MAKLEVTTWNFNNSIEKGLIRGRIKAYVEVIINGITMGYIPLEQRREFELPQDSYRVQCVLHYADSTDSNYSICSDIYPVELTNREEFVFVLYYIPFDGSTKGFDCGLRGNVPLRPEAREGNKENCFWICALSLFFFPFGFVYWLLKRKEKPKKSKKAIIFALISLGLFVLQSLA